MKKYLKTPEEVIDALHEGKTVFSMCGIYRLYKGILVEELEDGNYVISTTISNPENPYIEDPSLSR